MSPVWTPITPLTGSLFHAYSHNLRIVIVAKAEDL